MDPFSESTPTKMHGHATSDYTRLILPVEIPLKKGPEFYIVSALRMQSCRISVPNGSTKASPQHRSLGGWAMYWNLAVHIDSHPNPILFHLSPNKLAASQHILSP